MVALYLDVLDLFSLKWALIIVICRDELRGGAFSIGSKNGSIRIQSLTRKEIEKKTMLNCISLLEHSS